MALPASAALREHLRHVYRQAAALTVTPSAYLDTLADIALKADREGKTISATAAGGASVGFTVFNNFRPSDVLELIDALREPCESETVEEALVVLNANFPEVRAFGNDFSFLRYGGAL